MSDENKKNDFDEKLVGDYWEDYCHKREKIAYEMLNAWYEYTRKIEDAQKRLYDLKKTDGKKYDGTRYEDDAKNNAPLRIGLTDDGFMPVEGAKKITKAVDEAFPKIFDEVSRQLGSGSDMAMASAANIAHYAMSLPRITGADGFSWKTFFDEHYSNRRTVRRKNSGSDFYDEIIKYAKANRFAAIRASYNLALTCKTPDPTFVEDCERQLKRLDNESLDETYRPFINGSFINGEPLVDRQVRAKAAGKVLDFIAEWRMRERFTEWIRDGRPDKSRGSEKGDKGDDLSK